MPINNNFQREAIELNQKYSYAYIYKKLFFSIEAQTCNEIDEIENFMAILSI